MRYSAFFVLGLVLSMLNSLPARAGLPPGFPVITTTLYDPINVGEGSVLLATCPNANSGTGTPNYLLVLNNDGTPKAYKKIGNQTPGDFYGVDFKVLPDGTLFYQQFTSYLTYTGGGNCYGVRLDENLGELGRFQMGNGYVSESHDFQLLPNGHSLMMGYYTMLRDLSKVVPGGYPRAEVSGTIIQELNLQQQVIWQWRSWDHFDSKDYFWGTDSQGNLVSAWHENALRQDDDGDLFVETVQEVMKLSRQDGHVLWRLGGPYNQFTFAGVSQQEGVMAFQGHDFHRLPNGNVLIYNNTAPARSSRVQEYKLDEANKVATYVWSYVPTQFISGAARGSAERLPNGNTLIGWGTSLTPGYVGPDCTEVTSAGVKVWEMRFDNGTIDSYRAFRQTFPPGGERTLVLQTKISNGNNYKFANADGETGVSIDVQERVSTGYNSLTVTREPYSPLMPDFPGKAPRLLPLRVQLTPFAIDSIKASISFSANVFQFKNPQSLIVYFRPNIGHGLFVPLITSYNAVTGQVMAPLTDFGEFAFGFPDIAEIPYPPLLSVPQTLSTNQSVTLVTGLVEAGTSYTVNQAYPIRLAWSPKGFAESYHLQVSSRSNFTTLTVDADSLAEARYVFSNAAAATTYYWRVKASNDGGDSAWSSSSFATVPPSITVTSPTNTMALQRGLSYFIEWDDNLGGNVVLDLYKNGAFFKTIKTVPSTVSFKWQADLTTPPGSDYSLKVSSATNSALSAFSVGTFSLIAPPVIDASTVIRHTDGTVQFTFAAAGATQATISVSSNLSIWTKLRTQPMNSNPSVFVDPLASGFSNRFYRVQVP